MKHVSLAKFRDLSLMALAVVVLSLGNPIAKSQSSADKQRIADEVLSKADAQFANKNYSRAIESYTVVIGLEPTKGTLRYALWKRGDAKLEMRDHKGALEDYDQLFNVPSVPSITTAELSDLRYINFGKAMNNRGLAKIQIGDKAGACEDFGFACSIPKEYGESNGCKNVTEYCNVKTSSSTGNSGTASALHQLKIGTYTVQSQETLDFKNLIPLSAPAQIQIKIRSIDPDGTVKAQFVRGDVKGDLSGTIDSDGKLLLEGFLFNYSRREFKIKLVALSKDGSLTKGKYVADSSILKIIAEFSGSTFSNPKEDEDKLTLTPPSKSGAKSSSASSLQIGTYTADSAETVDTRGLPSVRWNKIIQIKVESLDNEGNIKLALAISGTKGEVAGRIDSGGNLQLNGYLFGSDRREFKLNMTTTITDGHFVNGRYVLESTLVKATGTFNIAVIVKDDF